MCALKRGAGTEPPYKLWTTEQIGGSSANNLAVGEIPFARSLMYIKKNKGPITEPHGTPARTGDHTEVWPFITTLWNLLFSKL